MFNSTKEQLYNFLISELDSIKLESGCSDIKLIFSGHGWDKDVIVLCINNNDWIVDSSGVHIKLTCPDCNFNLNSDGDNIINDIPNKLYIHKCTH